MDKQRRWLGALGILLAMVAAAIAAAPPQRLKVGVVQMARAGDFAGNRDRIIENIGAAAKLGARVVVVPEGALNNVDGAVPPEGVSEAISAIGRAAKENNVYVVLAGANRRATAKAGSKVYAGSQVNWMSVINPSGQEFFRYEKLYDNHQAKMPGVFEIDGIRCSGMICADRWLRGIEEVPIQQGAQVSFEVSDNFDCEWVGPFGWYWYVPRALRNNVWVVLSNAANVTAGVPDGLAWDPRLRHGHSAVIAPDGRIVAAAGEAAGVLMAEIEVGEATLAGAQARGSHPVLQPFWDAGVKLARGEMVQAPPLKRLESPEVEITLAVAQVIGSTDAMISKIREARVRHADVVVFPARATSDDALPALQSAARENKITVIFGAEFSGASHRDHFRLQSTAATGDGRAPSAAALTNSAFVIGPDGAILTRYDQLSATAPYQPGLDARSMWFRVKGVPAVVTVGNDALWTELGELAAVVGAQLHIHLDRDNAAGERLRRLQVWSNLASFKTFTAVANEIDSGIWDDLSGADETRHIVKGTPKPDNGPIEIYSDFSANLVVSATPEQPLVVATRRVRKSNGHHPTRTSNMNPQMEPWYRLGAALIGPE